MTSAARRRLRYSLTTVLLLVAATASAVFAVALGARFHARFDATASGEHTLSPRTTRLLASLAGPVEIAVVADFRDVDPASRRRIDDVLTEFERAPGDVRVSAIDAANDRTAYAALLDRLASLQADQLARHIGASNAGADAATQLAEGMPLLGAALDALAAALPPADARRRTLTDAAGAARVWATDLAKVVETARTQLDSGIAGSSVPAIDKAQQAIRPALERLAAELDPLRAYLADQFSSLPAGDPAGDAARSAQRQSAALRDAAATAADAFTRLGRLDLLAVVRAIEIGPAGVVVSPTGVAAVGFTDLFPSATSLAQAGARPADVRFDAEELLATAVAAVAGRPTPIIVFVHAQPQRLFDDSGEPASPEVARLMGRLVMRLASRRMDVAEWPVALEPVPPTPAGSATSGGERPVVWVVLPLLSANVDTAARLGKLADAAALLLGRADDLLFMFEPSTLPSVGESDPMAQLVEPFGLKVDSGRPLLRREKSQTGFNVYPGHEIVGDLRGHVIAESLEGLRTLLPWPVQITVDPAALSAWPLLQIRESDSTWAEAQWLPFRALAPQQRLRVMDPPAPDARLDDAQGPWIVAAAAERRESGGAAPQRLVVVGANGWFYDEFTASRRTIDGVSGLAYPGNGDLFESSVYWLAGEDEMVAPSSAAVRVPTIAALTAAQLAALRWALILGLPAAVLTLGAVLRLLRG